MKIVLVGLWFPHDCYDILHCIIVDYRIVNSYEEDFIQNSLANWKLKIVTKGIILIVLKSKYQVKKLIWWSIIQINFKENIEEVGKDQVLLLQLEKFCAKENNLHEFEVKKKKKKMDGF